MDLSNYSAPLFLFDPAEFRGCVYDPVVNAVCLNLPAGPPRYPRYRRHRDTALSPEFSGYLRYLTEHHGLFAGPACADLAEITVCEGLEAETRSTSDFSEYETAMLTRHIEFIGLPAYFDTLGFCFFDRALYKPVLCDVIETTGLG